VGSAGTRLAAAPSGGEMRVLSRLSAALGFSVVLAGVVAGCGVLPGFPTPTGPLLVVSTRGGECPAGMCESETVFERDGRVHVTKPKPAEQGRLPGATVAALDAAIHAADFAAIRSRPFEDTCPTAYDGQEVIYEFGTPSGTERIASCEVEIDPHDPLFVAVHRVLETSARE
jgi:hypothetical protein